MSGTEGARRLGLVDEGLVCQRLKTYWKGRGRMRWRTFLWRRLEERLRGGAEGREGGWDWDCGGMVVLVFSGEVMERDGVGVGVAITAAIEGYWSGSLW